MNTNEVVALINSHPEYAKNALDNAYHGKVFVTVASYGRIDHYFKTRRGAEGYINKQSRVSWYDDYSHEMVTAGSGLEIVEVAADQIKDYTTDKKMWHNWFLSWLDKPHWADNIVHTAKRWNVSSELLEWIEETAKEVKETFGLPSLKDDEIEEIEVVVSEVVESEVIKIKEVNNEITVNINEELKGIEIRFTDKPNQEVIEQLKSHGFRWSKRGFWYAKQSDKTITFADGLNGIQEQLETDNTNTNEKTSVQEFSYPEINIDDLEQYTVTDDLQRRLHGSSMFEVDYKKDCSVIFQQFQQQALEVIASTDNERIIYYIKKYLQSLKKRYYEQYIKILNHKANNPSWAVTGRGGLNARRYNKMQDRYDKYLGESVALSKEFDRKLGQFKSEIYRDNNNIIREQVNNTDLSNVEFKTVTKEMNIHGYEKKYRMHQYGGYSITKAWGCFRIFDAKGKEINANLKTTDTLETAKRYVLMLCQQETA